MTSYFNLDSEKKINEFLILREINRGSYGSVLETINLKNNNKYALKIIRNEDRFRKQSKHEITVLKNLNEKNYKNKYPIIKFYGYFNFKNHICLIFELLSDMNLGDLLKKTKYKGLEIKNVIKFSRQIAYAIKFIHNLNFIHCDLKPQNIVLVNKKKCKIKILDFGISRLDKYINNYFYIQSLYYRSPEVFEKKNYNKKIDIWSYGCILAELYTGFPFIYGNDEDKQYKLTLDVNNLIMNLKSKNNESLLPLKKLLLKCLQINHKNRVNIDNIIKDNFLKLTT